MRRLLLVGLLSTGIAYASDLPGTADGGLLNYAYFKNVPLKQDVMENVDWAWIKPGLNLNGHTVTVLKWQNFKIQSTSDKDITRASVFRAWFPGNLRLACETNWQGKVKVANEGDILLTGRVVDCNAGSVVAKSLIGFGAGSENATWDLALVDKASKEVLAAFHHRVISATGFSTLDTKAQKWGFQWATTLMAMAWLPTPDPGVHPIPVTQKNEALANSEALAVELERLQKMHDQKTITDEDFETLRKKAVDKAQSTTPPPPPKPAAPPANPELERLKKLHDQKLLTDEEFEILTRQAEIRAKTTV